MNKICYVAIAAATIIPMAGCKSQKKNISEDSQSSSEIYVAPIMRNTRPISVVPKATAFQMSGDYSDNVAISLDINGNVTYYPAPSDITADSRPVDLGNGWWLNRQGFGKNAVFTRYTYEEYSKLKKAPSHKQLREAVIPDAVLTGFQELPVDASEAMKHLDSLRSYVSKPHRKPVIMRPKH